VIEQVIYLGMGSGGSFGASAVVYGLIAIALVWAPKNEVEFFYWFWMRVGTFSITVRTTAILYIAFEFVGGIVIASEGFRLSSAVLHLLGAAIGAVIGVVMVKRNLVDCEGWDLFSLRRRRPGALPVTGVEFVDREANGEGGPPIADQRREALGLIRDYLKEPDPVMALTVYRNTVKETGPWRLPEPFVRTMIAGLNKAGHLKDAEPLLRQYITRFPEKNGVMKVLLGKVLIEHKEQPLTGLEVLESVPPETLKPPQRSMRAGLMRKAAAMRENGVLEMPDEEEA
jgi:hypothetical protein